MAALTNSRNTPEMADGGRMRVFPVEANTNIYLGGIVALNAAGNGVPASATTTVANALKVVGRAEYVKNGIPGQNALNNPGVAGAIRSECGRHRGPGLGNDDCRQRAQGRRARGIREERNPRPERAQQSRRRGRDQI